MNRYINIIIFLIILLLLYVIILNLYKKDKKKEITRKNKQKKKIIKKESFSESRKRLALLLFGISYIDNHGSRKTKVDFRESVDNYNEYIINHFNDLGYDIDIFIATNDIKDDNIKNELLNKYNPVKYLFLKHENNDASFYNLQPRQNKLLSVCDLCFNYSKENNIKYDHCLITRFDLEFKKKFNKSNIDYNTINIVSILEHPHLICDNFYLLPFNYLDQLYNVFKNNDYHHGIMNEIDQISKINYILNENILIDHLSFYKIKRLKIE